jgi:phenylacetic acid degradation operon negative regulatory protein
LERKAYLERQPGGSCDRIYRLTPKGRLAALGGRDPEQLWARNWDGKWRILMFDLPRKPQRPRVRLRKVLRENGLGCLQGSVWITPDPLDKIRKQLKGDRHPSSLLLFEGNAIGGEKTKEMVFSAWKFYDINWMWGEHERCLNAGKRFIKDDSMDTEELKKWAIAEYGAWKNVLELDPFLPKQLLPLNYRGRRIWKKRVQLWEKLSKRLKKTGFQLPVDSDKNIIT